MSTRGKHNYICIAAVSKSLGNINMEQFNVEFFIYMNLYLHSKELLDKF